jgi:hypothetical protein
MLFFIWLVRNGTEIDICRASEVSFYHLVVETLLPIAVGSTMAAVATLVVAQVSAAHNMDSTYS